MANNNVSLMIKTALDNAGIKATQEQIQSLSNQISKSNKQTKDGFNSLHGGITKLQGSFGGLVNDMVGGLGKVGIGITSAVALWKTFTEGLKIGQSAFKEFGDGAGYTLESIGNGFSSITQKAKNFFVELFTGTNDEKAAQLANKVAEQNNDAMVDKAKDASDKIKKYIKDVRTEEDNLAKSIDNATSRFVQQANTAVSLKNAKGDAELIALETNKFREQYAYNRQGQSDIAEQIGKMWDIEIAKVKARKKYGSALVDETMLEKQLKGAIEKLDVSNVALEGYKSKVDDAQAMVDELNGQKGNAVNIRRLKIAKDTLRDAKIAYAEKQEQNLGYASTVENLYYQIQANKQLQANMIASGQMSVDKAVAEYEDFVQGKGNIGNFSINRDYFAKLDYERMKSDYQLEKQTENTQLIIDKLDELLQVKGD